MLRISVIQVGLGGTGSHLAELVAIALSAKKWDSTLTLVDHDVYEHRNGNRQLIPQDGIGKNKAEAWKAYLDQKYPDLTIHAAPYKLTDDSIGSLIYNKNSIVLLCGDDLRMPRLVTEYVKDFSDATVVFSGGREREGNIYLQARRSNADVFPPFTKYHHGFLTDPLPTLGCARSEPQQQHMSTNVMCAAQMFVMFENILNAVPLDKTHNEVMFNLDPVNTAFRTIRRV